MSGPPLGRPPANVSIAKLYQEMARRIFVVISSVNYI